MSALLMSKWWRRSIVLLTLIVCAATQARFHDPLLYVMMAVISISQGVFEWQQYKRHGKSPPEKST
jgi:hypothetical protein